MTSLCCKLLQELKGKTLVTAESCTGGGIGAAITAIPGSSAIYKGGIISYCNSIKESMLNVDREVLNDFGAVSAPVAEAMAVGARTSLSADIAVSVTGLAGPDADDYGNPVGTVYIGYCDNNCILSRRFQFQGDRAAIRTQAIREALQLVLDQNQIEK